MARFFGYGTDQSRFPRKRTDDARELVQAGRGGRFMTAASRPLPPRARKHRGHGRGRFAMSLAVVSQLMQGRSPSSRK